MIFAEPNLLSADEIDPDFSDLIPISREVPVKSGSMTLFMLRLMAKFALLNQALEKSRGTPKCSSTNN
jgi:hypothetical protein